MLVESTASAWTGTTCSLRSKSRGLHFPRLARKFPDVHNYLPMSRVVGSAHHAAKVTEDDVRAMRRARSDGKSIDAIRQEYAHLGLSYSSVEKIVYRVSWKHVE